MFGLGHRTSSRDRNPTRARLRRFDWPYSQTQTRMGPSVARLCARICARTTVFLVVYREHESFREKSSFPLVNRLFFETKRNVLKSTISES